VPKRLVEFPLEKAGSVLVEVEVDDDTEFQRAGIGPNVIPTLSTKLGEALAVLPAIADTIFNQLTAFANHPAKITLDLGIKFGAKGNLIIAAGDLEANCKVKLKWSAPKKAT
jgi:Trypsin-co-occurring domain 1